MGPTSSSSNLNPTPSLSPKHSSPQLRTPSNPPPPPTPGFGGEWEKSQERRGSGTGADAVGLGGKVAAGKASYEGTERGEKMAPAPGVNVPKREGSGAQGFGRGGKAAIPAWQMAAGDEIAAGVIGQKLKNLGVVHRSLFLVHLKETTRSAPAPLPLCRTGLRPERVQRLGRSYQQCPCDHDDDAASLVGGLRVQSRDLMLDLLKG
ncbi:MAG: hypothetical protein L6R35_006020 [Caloplaca aegaea]|nr:MAG: hypothetical protein L6R35_006020 [Caloplaca aegaea]